MANFRKLDSLGLEDRRSLEDADFGDVSSPWRRCWECKEMYDPDSVGADDLCPWCNEPLDTPKPMRQAVLAARLFDGIWK